MTNLERRSNSYYEAVIIELQLTTSAQTATIMDYEKRLCDATRLANRVILIGEKEGWFEWKGDVETGGNHSSLHRDLTKVANQRVYKDFCDAHIMMIKTLEARIAELEALQTPKSCGTCSKKLLCKMAQDVKETYGTKLNEQWFVCYEPKDSND
jgi:hypothetical protein